MPRIVFKKSEHAPVDLHEAVIVGRSEQHANVVIKDNRLSRAHCRFEPRSGGGWAVIDLESQNGTFVNGRRAKEANIKGGDVITIGACDMVFEGAKAPTAAPGEKPVSAGFSSIKEVHAAPDNPDSTRTVVAPAALVLVKGTLSEKIHPVTQEVFNIGRRPDNQICIEGDPKVSGHHARIKRDGMSYFLEDLNSMNGVSVNGRKITEPVALRPGNIVVIGLQTFEFQLQGKPNVSSGATEPVLRREQVQAQLESGEIDGLNESAETPVLPPADATNEATEHDKAVMSQKVARVSGGAIFGVLEVLVVLLIAAGVLGAGYMMMKEGPVDPQGGGPAPNPAREGGLLAINPSFDEKDEGGFPKGWRFEHASTDSFALVEGARGGESALQVSRFTPGNAVSYAISAPVELKGERGIKASVFAQNSEFAVDRFGTAVLCLYWYEYAGDRDPLIVTPLVFKTRMDTWTELAGSAGVPTGVRAFSIAVGICGASGSVAFDDAMAEADNNAGAWSRAAGVKLANGFEWSLSEDGSISLAGPGEAQLLRGGRISVHRIEGEADPIDVASMLAAPPQVIATDASISAAWDYFDPLAERKVRLNLELKADGESARLSAGVAATADGPLDNAARKVALHVLATTTFVPAELLRFENGALMEWSSEITRSGASRKAIGEVLAANTGTGNRIAVAQGLEAAVAARQHGQGRELFLQADTVLALLFAQGKGQDEVQQMRALIADVQRGEDQVDRVNRALAIFDKYRYCQPEITAAAAAIDSAAKDYRLKLIELRDGINVHQLTRNERLYREAMEQSIHISERLTAMRTEWETRGDTLLMEAGQGAMSPPVKQAAQKARDALEQLVAVAKEFTGLETSARRSLFLLEIFTQQRDSEPLLVSARDFLQSGQYVQGMLKLRSAVSAYPRCRRGIEAKEMTVQAAEYFLNEALGYQSQGLKNIAVDRGVLTRNLLDLVESRMLVRILTPVEIEWLNAANFADGELGKDWLVREQALAQRMADLRSRLPAGLPPAENTSQPEDN